MRGADEVEPTRKIGEPASEPVISFPESPLLPPQTDTEKWLYSLARFGMKPGLRNIRALVEHFGHPERDLKFIHVAGTNGKGSTCLLMEGLLREAGWRTGLFTSPHLIHVGERLRVAGKPLADEPLAQLIGEVAPVVDRLQATFFETITIMALLHFRRSEVEWVLWETGLGGRLDSTRVVDPEVAVITGISLDHSRYLGDDLESIAREKLAIGRRGKPLFWGSRDPDLLELARGVSEEEGYRLQVLDEVLPWSFEKGHLRIDDPGCVGSGAENGAGSTTGSTTGSSAGRLSGRWSYPLIHGAQAVNIPLALATLSDLERTRGETLLPADPHRVLAGLRLPARFDRVRTDPPLVLDGAHNPEALAGTLAAWDRVSPGGAGVIIFGCMSDKEIEPLMAILSAREERIIFTAAAQGRAEPPESLLTRIGEAAGSGATPGGSNAADSSEVAGSTCAGSSEAGSTRADLKRECRDTLAQALNAAGESAAILVTGSIYLAAEGYQLLDLDPWRAD